MCRERPAELARQLCGAAQILGPLRSPFRPVRRPGKAATDGGASAGCVSTLYYLAPAHCRDPCNALRFGLPAANNLLLGRTGIVGGRHP